MGNCEWVLLGDYMTIQIDSREKTKAIKKIIAEFDKQGIKYYISKLWAGDYMSLDNPRLIVDRKQNLSELCQNVCQDHDRFRRELVRAQENRIQLIILCEHGKDIECLEDIIFWENPRLKKSPKATTGQTLYNILSTLQRKYGVQFEFCTKEQTGKRIVELLGENNGKKD